MIRLELNIKSKSKDDKLFKLIYANRDIEDMFDFKI